MDSTPKPDDKDYNDVECPPTTLDDELVKTTSVIGSLSFVDRFLSIWIISAMIIGVVTGFYSPETQSGLARINGKP
jgi:hypothetical protein